MKCKTALLAGLIVVLTAWITFGGRVIHVDGSAAGANDGTSWEDAYNYLQDALADAESGERPVEIRVAQGVYRPDRSTAEPNGTGDRDRAFQLINEVEIKGGYAGHGRLDPNARNVEAYDSVLSGDLAGDDIAVNDPCDLVDEPTRVENCYHVVTAWETDETSAIGGFTIRGGNANYHEYDYMVSDTRNNGAGLHSMNGSAKIENCTFCFNSAIEGGGGLRSFDDDRLEGQVLIVVKNCDFYFNSAMGGGAIECYGGMLKLHGCDIRVNRSLYYGGGMRTGEVETELVNCTFQDNYTSRSGGGLYSADKSVSMIGCLFRGNRAPAGGGACIPDLSAGLTVYGSRFIANLADKRGGAIALGALPNMTLENCTFAGNTAHTKGGAVSTASYGKMLLFKNCTLIGNISPTGSAISHDGNPLSQYDSYELRNCIVWNGVETIWNNTGTPMNINYGDLQGGAESIDDPYDAVILSNSNIDADPCFVESGYWDPNGTPDDPNDDLWVDGDYHLKSQAGRWDHNSQSWVQDDVTSLCIDAGDPIDAVGFEPFPNGGIVNMGAHGATAEASKSYLGRPVCETILPADINGDCLIDFLDVMLMTTHWLVDNTPPLPGQATNPLPDDGATDINTYITLTWTPGAETTSYDVYFGPTSPGAFQANKATPQLVLTELSGYTTYYWRIDSVSHRGKTTGQVWQFTTGKASMPR